MLLYLQTPLLAALTILELAVTVSTAPAPAPHPAPAPNPYHSWSPLPEWNTNNEPVITSWDYLGLGNPYHIPVPAHPETPGTWVPPSVTSGIQVVRAFRKPAVDPSSWAQIPVISGDNRDNTRLLVALVPRGYEDFVLVRKPFVIVEEDSPPSKGKPKSKSKSKDSKKTKTPEPPETPEEEEEEEEEEPEGMKKPEKPSSRRAQSSTTTMRSTSPSSTTSSTTTSTMTASPSTDDNDNSDTQSNTTDSQK